MSNSFLTKLKVKWDEGKFLCVGLDSDTSKIPSGLSQLDFNKKIIDATADLVCCFKPNSAFYEAEGPKGLKTLADTVNYIHEKYPDIPVLLDAKRGDIGNTNDGYVKAIFDTLGLDAVTVSPYLGKESLQPFLDRADKGIIVLVKTSNPGAGEFQDLNVDGPLRPGSEARKPLYQVVAEHVKEWNTNGNLGVVVGSTYPDELKIVRGIVGDMPILIPGTGAQGGDLEATIKNGLDSNKQGLIINSSRGIIFAEDPRKAAEDLHNQIQEAIK